MKGFPGRDATAIWKWIEANVDEPVGRQMLVAGGRSDQVDPIRPDAARGEIVQQPGLEKEGMDASMTPSRCVLSVSTSELLRDCVALSPLTPRVSCLPWGRARRPRQADGLR